jgi:hypothetical protein
MRTSASVPVPNAFQTVAPVGASRAITQPRTPNSPPLFPTSTFPFTTRGAMLMVSPTLMSPTRTRHASAPVAASTAITWLSRVLKKIFPSAYAAPRLTRPQQATPGAARCTGASYIHFFGAPGRERSSA